MPEAYISLPRSVSVGHLLHLGDTLVGYSILELVRVGNTVWPVQLHPASISQSMAFSSDVTFVCRVTCIRGGIFLRVGPALGTSS